MILPYSDMILIRYAGLFVLNPFEIEKRFLLYCPSVAMHVPTGKRDFE
jgi:hypothetical protein